MKRPEPKQERQPIGRAETFAAAQKMMGQLPELKAIVESRKWTQDGKERRAAVLYFLHAKANYRLVEAAMYRVAMEAAVRLNHRPWKIRLEVEDFRLYVEGFDSSEEQKAEALDILRYARSAASIIAA